MNVVLEAPMNADAQGSSSSGTGVSPVSSSHGREAPTDFQQIKNLLAHDQLARGTAPHRARAPPLHSECE